MIRIDVKRNESLIKERAFYRQFLMGQMKKSKRTHNLPKNIIVLYIDALSRKRLQSKMPKVYKWINNIKQSKSTHTLTSGERFVSLAAFTWHNMLAYYYGVVSNDNDIFENSLYSMTTGASNVETISKFNPQLGKNVTSKVYAGPPGEEEAYSSILRDIKKAGYITALTSTDCSTNPLTQEIERPVNFLKSIKYDHMGIIHSCDPNYLNPADPDGLGGGPYSLFRRCLYGKEQMDNSVEYAQQFLTKYSDQPKFLEMSFIEAHEGTQEVITHLDDKFLQLINWMDQNGHVFFYYHKVKFKFEDSIFLILSDHGMHLNNLMATMKADVFFIEVGLPLQVMLIDNKILNKADLESLMQNQQSLTTMYEIHYFYKYLFNNEQAAFNKDNSLLSNKIKTERDSYDLPMFAGLPLVCKNPKRK